MQFQTSADSFVDELNVFCTPNTEGGVVKSEFIEYKPCSQISQTGPIDFCFTSQENQYLDLHTSLLKVSFVVEKASSAVPASQDPIFPVNNILHALWSQVDVYLNQTLVSPCTNNYNYKSYFDNVLKHNINNNEIGKTQLWFNDEAGAMESTVTGPTLDENPRSKRHDPITGVASAIGPLLHDLASTKRWILPGIDVNIRLWQTNNKFRLMQGATLIDEFTLKFTEVIFLPNYITVKPSITDAHLSLLRSGHNAIYPFKRHQLQSFNIPAATTFFRQDQIFQNEKPDKVIIALVDAEAYQGNYLKNPYNFQHFDISSIDFTINDKSLNGRPLDVSLGNFNEVFYHLTSFSSECKANGPDIGLKDFGEGYAIYIFDDYAGLEKPTKSVTDIQSGFSKIIMKFSTGLPVAVIALVYGIFNDVFEIDQNKKVIVNK